MVVTAILPVNWHKKVHALSRKTSATVKYVSGLTFHLDKFLFVVGSRLCNDLLEKKHFRKQSELGKSCDMIIDIKTV